MLSNHFNIEHFEKTICNLVPTGNGTNVVEHGGSFSKSDTFLNTFNKSDATKIHVVVFISESDFIVDSIGLIIHVALKLASSEVKSQIKADPRFDTP